MDVNQETNQPAYLQFLPNELLVRIMKYLDWYDLRSAMFACRALEDVAFYVQSDILRFKIVPDTGARDTQYQYEKLMNYHSTLMKSNRPYKHLSLSWGSWDERNGPDQINLFLEIINYFHQSLVSLKISSEGHCMTPQVMSEILESCPNLKELDLNDMNHTALSFEKKTTFKTNIQKLHDSHQVITCDPRASILFDNVTTLHVKLTPCNTLNDLFHTLSHKLVHLTLSWDVEESYSHVLLPRGDFPLLETLVLVNERVGTDRELGEFLQRMPKLRALTLSPHENETISVLEWINPDNLRHLDVWPFDVELAALEQIIRFQNLESLCIRGHYQMDDEPPEDVVLEKLKHLALQGFFSCLSLDELFVYVPNLVELELKTKQNWNSEDSRVFNVLTSLERLILHGGVHFFDQFMEFCEDLNVPHLTIVTEDDTFFWEELEGPRLRIAPFIRKLSIHALMIDQGLIGPLMQSMPNLSTLELTLQIPLDNDVFRRICTDYPRCKTIRKGSRLYESVLNLYERHRFRRRVRR